MVLKKLFALILCLPAAEHHFANSNFIMLTNSMYFLLSIIVFPVRYIMSKKSYVKKTVI
jgi:hypothetical protein